MHTLSAHVSMVFDKRLYSKDPMSSSLGQELIKKSVEMIYQDGLEQFTFKKLANALGSTESTMYRYFHNKHQLAMYLASWHWSQMEWRIAFATANIADPHVRIHNTIRELCLWVKDTPPARHLNELKLQRILITEGLRGFIPQECSKNDKEGYFAAYTLLCDRVANIFKASLKSCAQPHALAALTIEAIHHQMYLQLHLPHLTELRNKENQLQTFVHQILHIPSIK
jgi:AcrR family transcriptional regulator